MFEIYPNAKYGKIFDAGKLIKQNGPMHSLAAVLTGMCDYPRLIEECLVDSGRVEASGAYLTQIQMRGACKQFMVDDCVPITSAGDSLFLRPAIVDRNSDQIDVWPQIIAKS